MISQAGLDISPIYNTHALHNNSCKESIQSTSIQQSPKTDSRHLVSDSKPDSAIKSDTPWNMAMKSGQSPTKSQIKTRSGWDNCRPERLGMDT